jgi:hypothetical protein
MVRKSNKLGNTKRFGNRTFLSSGEERDSPTLLGPLEIEVSSEGPNRVGFSLYSPKMGTYPVCETFCFIFIYNSEQ